jgi:hypothetical protein
MSEEKCPKCGELSPEEIGSLIVQEWQFGGSENSHVALAKCIGKNIRGFIEERTSFEVLAERNGKQCLELREHIANLWKKINAHALRQRIINADKGAKRLSDEKKMLKEKLDLADDRNTTLQKRVEELEGENAKALEAVIQSAYREIVLKERIIELRTELAALANKGE